MEPGQSAVRRAILRRTAALDEAVVPSSVDLPPPPPFPPVDPSQLIGLLRPWYDQKLAAGDIAEDEDKKEKVPPAPFKVRAEMAKQLKKRKELGMT